MLTFQLQAQVECDVLRNVQDLVEANYENGRPKHHLPSAYMPERQEGASIFFMVQYEDFVKMSGSDIQRIGRHRHIVVRGVPQEHHEWNHATLSQVGSLNRPRDMQGKWLTLT